MTTPTDWRGTPITPGTTVVYGAGVGRSIELVQATVNPAPSNPNAPHCTASGDIWLTVIHRSYQRPATDQVHVGPDRLTVVTALPPTELPTVRQKIADEARSTIARHSEALAQLIPDGPDRPTHDQFGRPHWTADEETAWRQREIAKAERKLREYAKDGAQ